MPSPSLLQRLKERKLVQWGQPNLAKPQGSLPEKKTLRQKLTESLKSGHIHISLATGISIIVMAYASSRILPEPMPYLLRLEKKYRLRSRKKARRKSVPV